MTLKRRILILVLGTVAGGLLLAGVAVALAGYYTVERDVSASLRTEMDLVVRTLQRNRTPVLPAGDGWRVLVLTPAGAVVRGQGGAPLPNVVPTPGAVVRQSNFYLMSVQSNEGVVVVVGETRRVATAPLRNLLFDLALVDLAVLILVAIASNTLAEGTLLPLRRAAGSAERIGRSGRPKGRLPGGDRQDEVGVLVMAVNGLLDRLDGAFQELEVARERERSFVADAGHDLKTPLTIIKGNVELLERKGLDADSRSVALKETLSAVKRMTALLDRLVLAARGEIEVTGKKEALDLQGEAEDLFNRFSVRAEGLQFTKDLQPTGKVLADPLEVQRALDILMDNALRYTQGPGGKIRIRSGVEGQEAYVLVEDNGPGVRPEDRERIFERFVRLDEARSPGGHGLGLSIARAIARAMGGEIRLETEVGSGSRFVFLLPIANS